MEEYVHLSLFLFEGEIAALDRQAKLDGMSIGKLIRLEIRIYLSDSQVDKDFEDQYGDSQNYPNSCSPNAMEVMLLLPSARLAELETLATKHDATAIVIVRQIIRCYLLREVQSQPALKKPANTGGRLPPIICNKPSGGGM
ncbi:hypothetical protein [Zavarzinella formosa]|uniref:hypothetical protein n=1 Tax=Zavarzinella formosa TaxID=360055 RepID=UPI0012F9C25F|nr:hypothetical protein [Zavarzinella formosa]